MNTEPAKLTATVTPVMEQIMKETLNLEIEMLQGTRIVLSDGMIQYSLVIEDEQKAELVKEFVLKIISQSHIKNLS